MLRTTMRRVELRLVRWVDAHGVDALRYAFALVFVWFGALKFCGGLCDVEVLAGKTLMLLTLGLVPMKVCVWGLAVAEVSIGLSLLVNRWTRVTTWCLLAHLCGTFLPLVLFPHETWKHVGWAPTLAGQYIVKNVILIGGAMLVAAKAARRERVAAVLVGRPVLVRGAA